MRFATIGKVKAACDQHYLETSGRVAKRADLQSRNEH
jgi:hypothetical protein